MADAIQPATRNLYQKKFAYLEYRDGGGHTLLAYEKRCAAYAHVGKYKKALADAQHVLLHENSARAANRVKTLEGFLAAQAAGDKGSEGGAVTLCLTLTPRELRQWRAQGPSLYNL